MTDLWTAIAEVASSTHADRITVIAEAIAGLSSVAEFDRIKNVFGSNIDQAQVEHLRTGWERVPSVSPKEIAFALNAAAQVVSLIAVRGALELVWSGPRTGFIPTRQTEQVMLEVIDSAETDLFLVTYVFYRASSIVVALNAAVARGVTVSILLESSTEHGGTVRGDSVVAVRDAVPGASIYVWGTESRKSGGDTVSAAVHAKCAVADSKLAFITSANLTTAALERNMELGMLVRGGMVPAKLRQHLEALITTNVIKVF